MHPEGQRSDITQQGLSTASQRPNCFRGKTPLCHSEAALPGAIIHFLIYITLARLCMNSSSKGVHPSPVLTKVKQKKKKKALHTSSWKQV